MTAKYKERSGHCKNSRIFQIWRMKLEDKDKSDHGSKFPLRLNLCSFSVSPEESKNLNILNCDPLIMCLLKTLKE